MGYLSLSPRLDRLCGSIEIVVERLRVRSWLDRTKFPDCSLFPTEPLGLAFGFNFPYPSDSARNSLGVSGVS